MSTILTGNHPKALWPGVYSWFGAEYGRYDKQYEKLFTVKSSTGNYEELVQHTGFGLAPVKPEGSGTAYDSHQQGYVARGTNVAYSLGYIVSREELADNKYQKVSMARAGSLARSMAETRNWVGANIYNRAFTSGYNGGDGVVLISASHPSVAGNQSNIIASAADLSESALEDLAIQIMNATDPKGLKISIRPKSLIIPVGETFNAQRILKSQLRSDSANNDTNALKLLGVIPEIVVNNYLTDADAWFIRTGVQDGLCWFDREAVEFTKDTDFDTDNAKAKGYMRFVPFWGDWRDLYGSAGA